MSHVDTAIEMARNNGGYLILKEAVESGIPTAAISQMTRNGKFEKAAPGVYLLPDCLQDELYEMAVRYKSLVFCRSTAIYLQGLSNRRLEKIEANFPSHFNTNRLTGIVCHYPSERLYKLGICEVETPLGHMVKGYDVERCLCDLFYYRDDFDPEERVYALENVDRRKIDFPKLLTYARELKVEKEIMTIMEVIL